MKFEPEDRSALFIFGLLGTLKALGLVLMAEGLAGGISGAFAGTEAVSSAALRVVIGAALLAFVAWLSQVFAARTAIGTKQALRQRLTSRILRTEAGSGSVVTATLGLDELDAWYRTVLPAVAATATVPLLVGARILFADWISAVVIVLTVPLVPIFMALVGLHAKDRADAASATLALLSTHVTELARGLPVLVGLNRVADQSQALGAISEAQRVATVRTLRTAFLSSLVLELIATISVAIVAVFVGLRLLNGDLGLEIGLVALVLAPECFAPFRELGSAFHSSQAGLAARRRVTELLAVPERAEVRTATGPIAAREIGVDYAGLDGVSFTLEPGSVTAIIGASGAGKSTLLAILAGAVSPTRGTVSGIDPATVAYAPQHPHTVGDTTGAELELYGALDASRMLAQFGLTASAVPANLSPGELRRLALARALVRVENGATILLLDEPTAHLDADSSREVTSAIERLRGTVTIVLVSHDQAVVDLADNRVVLGASTFRTVASAHRARELTVAPTLARPAARRGALTEFLSFLRPTFGRTIAAAVLGAAAVISGLALLATSGWLIVEASTAGAIMYLLVAIVGVRFFGLARSVLRYTERLLTHDAALGSIAALRARTWALLAERGLSSRALASGDAALGYLVDAPERILQLVPRIVAPLVTAVLASAASLVTAAVLAPTTLPALAIAIGGGLLLAPTIAVVADRTATRTELSAKSLLMRELAQIASAAPELAANGLAGRVSARVTAHEAAASRAARRAATASGLGAAVVLLATGLASAAALSLGAPTASLLAVIVLLLLGLTEPLLAAGASVQLIPALRAQLRTVHELSQGAVTTREHEPGIPSISVEGLAVAWPGCPPVFRGANAVVHRGQWLVVEGPSGAGKSTLVAAILGHLPVAEGRLTVRGSGVAWAPQEAHIFDSTVRGNLALARTAPESELRQALAAVGLGLDLDFRVGSEGNRLSGGQRQRLAVARALLTRADIVVLDEPTAHLDARAASALMGDLRAALSDRVVVLVTHHADDRTPTDLRLTLSATGSTELEDTQLPVLA